MKQFFKEVLVELSHVSWPSRRATIWYTIAIIIISLGIAYYLGLFDLIFSKILENVL